MPIAEAVVFQYIYPEKSLMQNSKIQVRKSRVLLVQVYFINTNI